jgi:hypothetical protein
MQCPFLCMVHMRIRVLSVRVSIIYLSLHEAPFKKYSKVSYDRYTFLFSPFFCALRHTSIYVPSIKFALVPIGHPHADDDDVS